MDMEFSDGNELDFEITKIQNLHIVTKGLNGQQDIMGQVYKGAINLVKTITL